MEPINTGIATSPEMVPPVSPQPDMRDLFKKLLERFSKSRFYSNKKIFWPVTVASGLILITLIVGLIFGGVKMVVQNGVSPTPTITVTPKATEIPDVLTVIKNQLVNLKSKINNLDVRQSRLQPPTINFNVKF